eukprot:2026885-Ditylum_brightwellii.AAC.1
MHKELDLQRYRHHTHNELLILDNVALSNLSIAAITQFSLCPPELRDVINKIGTYYQWFTVSKKKLSPEDIRNTLSLDLRCSLFIDGLECQVRIRRKALNEMCKYLEENFVNNADDDVGLDVH